MDIIVRIHVVNRSSLPSHLQKKIPSYVFREDKEYLSNEELGEYTEDELEEEFNKDEYGYYQMYENDEDAIGYYATPQSKYNIIANYIEHYYNVAMKDKESHESSVFNRYYILDQYSIRTRDMYLEWLKYTVQYCNRLKNTNYTKIYIQEPYGEGYIEYKENHPTNVFSYPLNYRLKFIHRMIEIIEDDNLVISLHTQIG
jgi:hypothetical protein